MRRSDRGTRRPGGLDRTEPGPGEVSVQRGEQLQAEEPRPTPWVTSFAGSNAGTGEPQRCAQRSRRTRATERAGPRPAHRGHGSPEHPDQHPRRRSLAATLNGNPIILARPVRTGSVAFSAICTHHGCTVDAGSATLHGPCHGSTFTPSPVPTSADRHQTHCRHHCHRFRRRCASALNRATPASMHLPSPREIDVRNVVRQDHEG
jgi:Rieske Fe-S protein